MKHTILILTGALAFTGTSGRETLDTDYTQTTRALRIETETTIATELTDFTIERDGEPMDMGGGGGGGGSEESMRSVVIDTVLGHEGGKPMRVRRVFEELESTTEVSMRDETREYESDCPLSGCTLELTVDEEGEVDTEVVDGDEPDDDALLEGHTTALALDALLPTEDVDAGASWELDSDAVRRILGLDLRGKLYPRPEPEGGRDGGREGGRGGRRGPGGRGGGGGGVLGTADWDGTATLASTDEEYDGVPCAVIEFELNAGGELEEPEFEGRGGGRRGRQDVLARNLTLAPLFFGTEYEIEIKGSLYVSKKERRPLAAEFEGTLLTETRTERSRGESTMVMTMTREGTFERTVTITSVAVDDEDAD